MIRACCVWTHTISVTYTCLVSYIFRPLGFMCVCVCSVWLHNLYDRGRPLPTVRFQTAGASGRNGAVKCMCTCTHSTQGPFSHWHESLEGANLILTEGWNEDVNNLEARSYTLSLIHWDDDMCKAANKDGSDPLTTRGCVCSWEKSTPARCYLKVVASCLGWFL